MAKKLELERCREKLHQLEQHPDYDYRRSIDNRDIGDDWHRNPYFGFDGYWHWYRSRKPQ